MAFISNGTTILDAGAFSVGLGSKILLSTATASASASIEFTSGIDSTYDIYKFEFINIHPSVDSSIFSFQGNAVGGSGFNETITSTSVRSLHNETDSYANVEYRTDSDQAQGTDFHRLSSNAGIGSDADQNLSGELYVYNPSSTTFVKHFISTTNCNSSDDFSFQTLSAGYFNTTSALDEFQFKFSSGNIDSGTIKLYGIKDSWWYNFIIEQTKFVAQ